jgi:exopolysaccharide biosynthesis protein
MKLLNFAYLFALIFSLSTCHAKPSNTGIIYQDYHHATATLIHVITIDPTKVKIVAARAQDAGKGLCTVAEVAKHFSALAAINGGFFRFNQSDGSAGVSAGALKVNNAWHGIAYSPRGAIGWDPNKNLVLFDVLQTQSKLLLNQQPMPINAMNKLSNGSKGILLSDSYIDPISLEQSMAVVFAKNRVTQIYNAGVMTIPSQAHVYRISGKLQEKIAALKIGDPVNLEIKALPQIAPDTTTLWNTVPYIVGGGPIIIHNGKLVTDFTREKLRTDFVNQRYARTAVGILPDSRWVFVVAERNIMQDTTGLTISELGIFMQSLGCVAALNLDGGGSSSMYVQSEKINELEFSRPVADALLILPRD